MSQRNLFLGDYSTSSSFSCSFVDDLGKLGVTDDPDELDDWDDPGFSPVELGGCGEPDDSDVLDEPKFPLEPVDGGIS